MSMIWVNGCRYKGDIYRGRVMGGRVRVKGRSQIFEEERPDQFLRSLMGWSVGVCGWDKKKMWIIYRMVVFIMAVLCVC